MDRSELVTCAAMQCEGVGKPVHILTSSFKRDANVDTLPTHFELNNYLFPLITSSSAKIKKIEILYRSELNENSLLTTDISDFTQQDDRKKRKTPVKRLCAGQT